MWGDGFEIETLIHVRVAKAGLVVAEVPSFEHKRLHGVSNLHAFRDGRRVLWTILSERLRTNRQHPAGAVIKPARGESQTCTGDRAALPAVEGMSRAEMVD